MSHENDSDDGENGDDSPRTYRDYQLAKNPRANDPEDAGPRDPAAEIREEHGVGSGFEDVLEGDGDVSKSTQEEMEDALADADFLGTEPVAKGDDDRVSLAWSREDFEDDPTEADLLAEIRDELARMNAADREGTLKSLADSGAGQRWVDLLDAEETDESTADAVATLERIEDELERREQADGPTGLTEEQAAKLEDALNAYVEAAPENGLDEPLADIVTWMREQSDGMDTDADGAGAVA